jgi:hypothetical protein
MAHSGDGWERRTPRRADKPVLVIDGRRSVYAAWPPDAVCEACGGREEGSGGYVGPVAGREAHYPDPSMRFLCEKCARDKVGLEEGELSGHACQQGCTDDEHIEPKYLPNGVIPTLEYFAEDYANRGWQVTEVSPEPSPASGHPRTLGHTPWDVRFMARRRHR